MADYVRDTRDTGQSAVSDFVRKARPKLVISWNNVEYQVVVAGQGRYLTEAESYDIV